jgi:ribosomal protein S18 acetylase RimI-like enzyme
VNLTIRPADLTSGDDSSAVVFVVDSYARDPAGGGRPLPPDVRARLPDALRDHPTSVVFLAFVDGQPAGVAVCFVGFSTFHARPLLNIHDLAVVPEHRGRGIGRALLAAVEAEAVRRDCCRLTLEVQDENRRARRVYDRFGFVDFAVAGSTTRFLCKSLGSTGSRTSHE